MRIPLRLHFLPIFLLLPAAVSVAGPSRPAELNFSTFLGGSRRDGGEAAAVDPDGNIYLTGWTRSDDFPTAGAFQGGKASDWFDCFVAKFSPDGRSLTYSTYLGGPGLADNRAYAIAVDRKGRAIVAGFTDSPDFPVKNPLAGGESLGGEQSAFVARFSADGKSLDFSTYLGGGGKDVARGAAVDEEGNIFVAGDTTSDDFPTKNAYQPARAGLGEARDAFVTRLAFDEESETLSIVYSTYLGGGGEEQLYALALGADGSAYPAGRTGSADFPTKNPFQGSRSGAESAFFARLSPEGDGLLHSTYLGGGGALEWAEAIAVDPEGAVYVAGVTSSADFPTRNALLPERQNGLYDGFIAKFPSPGEDPVFSTYLGGRGNDVIRALAIGPFGLYAAGDTTSADFPTVSPYQGEKNLPEHKSDAFISLISPDGSNLLFSTFLGGSEEDRALGLAVDGGGRAVVAGRTGSADFPTAGDRQPFRGSREGDAFIAGFAFLPPPSPVPTPSGP